MNAPQVYVTSAQAGGALLSHLAFFGVLAVVLLVEQLDTRELGSADFPEQR
jgi:hypothetical protein